MKLTNQLTLAAVVVLAAVLTACNDAPYSEQTPVIEAIPFQAEQNGPWGLLTTGGGVLCTPRFEYCPTVVTEGLFFAKDSTSEYCLYRAGAEPKRVGTHKYTDANCFINGRAVVTYPNDYIRIIDTEGRVIRKLDMAAGDTIANVIVCNDGYIVYHATNGMYGLLKPDGELAIKAEYNRLNYNHGIVTAKPGTKKEFEKAKETGEGYNLIMNREGEELGRTDSHWDISDIIAGQLLVCHKYENEKYVTILDRHGKEVLSNKYNIAGSYEDLLICTAADNEDKHGIVNNEGKVLIQPIYNIFINVKKDRILAGVYSKDSTIVYQLIDMDGKPVNGSRYKRHFLNFESGNGTIAAQKTDDKWVWVKPDGTETEIPTVIKYIEALSFIENDGFICSQSPTMYIGKWKGDIGSVEEDVSVIFEFIDSNHCIFGFQAELPIGSFSSKTPGTYSIENGILETALDIDKTEVSMNFGNITDGMSASEKKTVEDYVRDNAKTAAKTITEEKVNIEIFDVDIIIIDDNFFHRITE